MGCDPAIIGQSGVTVAGHPNRAESHVSSGYLVGDHLVITCDPAAEQRLTQAATRMEPTLESWAAVAAEEDGELLGSGRMQLLAIEGLPAVKVGAGYSVRTLDRASDADVALIARLIDASDADDLDEAELDLDELDNIIEVIVDSEGQIASYASSHGFDMAPEYGDIGIITHPDHRNLGLGSAAVAAVCRRIRDEGYEPLYRCDETNAGSIALSSGLGFTNATQLTVFRFPT